MVLLPDPGVYMPESVDDFCGTSWMIAWETRVTQSFEVSHESIDDLANEVLRRWAVLIEDEVMCSGHPPMGWLGHLAVISEDAMS